MIGRECSLIRMLPPNVLDRGLLYVSGATVPTDGTDGYQTGCIFQHTDGGGGTALYVNEGSVTSSAFNAIHSETGPIVLDGVTTGNAITISGTYERAFDLSSLTPGTTTDGVIMRVGSGIGTSALAMPDGSRGFALYMRNTGTSGTLTGVRLRCVSDASATSNGLNTLHVQSSVVATKSATTINSAFVEIVPKGSTQTIGTARGLLVNIDSAATLTYTSQLTVAHFRIHTRGDETMSGVDEMIRVENEAVGGNGRQMDSFIRCMGTTLSGGIKAAGYLIDGGVATDLLGTAFLRLGNDGTVCDNADPGNGSSTLNSDFTGFITVVIGTGTRYIPLMTNKPSALS